MKVKDIDNTMYPSKIANHIVKEQNKEIDRLNNIIIDQQRRIDKTNQAIEELLTYDDFMDITSASFGNVKEQLKFYLSSCESLEEFRLKEGNNNE